MRKKKRIEKEYNKENSIIYSNLKDILTENLSLAMIRSKIILIINIMSIQNKKSKYLNNILLSFKNIEDDFLTKEEQNKAFEELMLEKDEKNE